MYNHLLTKIHRLEGKTHSTNNRRKILDKNRSMAAEGEDVRSLISTSNTTEDASVRAILDRIQKNYERLRNILQNKASDPIGSPNSIGLTNEKLLGDFSPRLKRSDETVENETDVEYRKYGGYISTKIFLPLGEDVTTPYSKDNEMKTENLDQGSSANERIKNENYYFVESHDSSVTKSPQISTEDKEAFIQLMDEFVDAHTNKTIS